MQISPDGLPVGDYINLTDIARWKNPDAPSDVVKNWMRTVEALDERITVCLHITLKKNIKKQIADVDKMSYNEFCVKILWTILHHTII